MQSRKVWRFISDAVEGQASREITVADEASARHLAEILCLDSVRWRLQSEEVLAPDTVTKMITKSIEQPQKASQPEPEAELTVDELEESPKVEAKVEAKREVLATKAVQAPPSFKAPAPASLDKKREERRGAKRVEARLRIILMNQTRTFRAFSSDLSLGGAKLDRSIPTEILGTRCRVLIGDAEGRQNLALECEILADKNSARRLRFADVSNASVQELEKWLAKAVGAKVA